jgi:hypothetical protein
MLALARRGVAVTGVIGLNRIIEDYLAQSGTGQAQIHSSTGIHSIGSGAIGV